MYYMKTHYELMALDIQTLKKNEYKNELSVGPSACDITNKGLNYFLIIINFIKKSGIFLQNSIQLNMERSHNNMQVITYQYLTILCENAGA